MFVEPQHLSALMVISLTVVFLCIKVMVIVMIQTTIVDVIGMVEIVVETMLEHYSAPYANVSTQTKLLDVNIFTAVKIK